MGRTIVRGRGIDRRLGRRIRVEIGLPGGTLEAVGLVGILEAIGREILVVVRVAILGEAGRLGILGEIVRVETREVHREEEIPGIVLEIRGELRLAIREGPGPVVGMLEHDLVGQHLETPAGIDLAEIRVGMLEVDLQAITRGLRGILMRDFRREAIARRGNHNHDHSHNRCHNLSLSSDLSRGRRLQALDRVGSAGITMPEQRGRRAIAVEPVQVAVAETGEVDSNEIARVDVWIDCCGSGGFRLGSFAGAECGSEDVSYLQRGGEGICDGGEGK
jgi:hypothetical protein